MAITGAWGDLLDTMTASLRDTFGQSVTYTRKDGTIYEITAIFDIAYSASEAGDHLPANIPIKELDIRLDDISGKPPSQGDEVLIDGTSYQVKDIKQSTSGMMKAILREMG